MHVHDNGVSYFYFHRLAVSSGASAILGFVMTTLSNSPTTVDGLRSRPTMRDVAALAGVSLKTVSRVVNSESGVSEVLIGRVKRAADELDYRHDLTASNLRRSDRKTATIGLIFEDVSNPYFSSVHRGIEEVAREHGTAVFAASVDENPARERDLVVAFTRRRVDAIIMSPTVRDQTYLDHERRGGLAVVFVDREPRGFDADCVVTDNEPGAALATRHLLERGHIRIAFVGDYETITTASQRHAGYAKAMSLAGATAFPDLVRRGVRTKDAATEAVLALLDAPEPPTAIFTAQNLITMGAVRALQVRGLQHSVALVGFDDFVMADALDPGVTVVAQDAREIGRMAARLAFARIEAPDLPTAVYVVPSGLVIRGSGEIPPGR
jgi:LacI family transcriptional regulator